MFSIRIFDATGEIFSGAIFFQLFCNVIFFACSIYQMEIVMFYPNIFVNSGFTCENAGSNAYDCFSLQSIKAINVFLLFSFLCLIEGLLYTFILCYYATESTTSLSSIADIVYDSNWYMQPKTIQRMLITVMARAQRPEIYMGFKFVQCTSAAFMRVLKLNSFHSSQVFFSFHTNNFFRS